MSNQHGPLSQFEIKPLAKLSLAGYDVSFTNSSLFMVTSLIAIVSLMFLSIRKVKIIPNSTQSAVELLYLFVAGTINDTVGNKGQQYFSFIFSLFIFVITCNLMGMLPYSFTVTSHIIVTLALALTVFLAVTIIAFIHHGWHFFSFFLPEGTPLWLAPLMILIEVFTYLTRPVTLSIRLASNMMAGHILLKVIAGFAVMMGLMWAWIPVPFIVIFTGLEIFVAILQAYIFTVLTCVYLNDAINLH